MTQPTPLAVPADPTGPAGTAHPTTPHPTTPPPTTIHPEPAALGGHHRSWRVLRPTAGHPSTSRVKTGVPHRGVPRFDPRCVLDEDGLLRELSRRGVPRTPRAHHAPAGLQTHDYIEGQPLSWVRPPGTPLTGRQLGHVISLFGALATVSPTEVALLHACPPSRRPVDSGGFLRSLLRFSRERVHQRHAPDFPGLFPALGVSPRALSDDGPLGRAADGLTDRPFCLLHGDLHRDNLIVAAGNGALWTIDWELALVGDPLYDLATHLHLMHYPRSQERRLITRWARAVDAALPGAADGLTRDLPQYLRYKQVQSVFTDTVRHAQAAQAAAPLELPAVLAAAGRDLSGALRTAAVPLGLHRVPSADEVEQVFAGLVQSRTPTPQPVAIR